MLSPDTGERPCDEPLRLAIKNNHYEEARLLLEAGADPNKRYSFGSLINSVWDPKYMELLLTFGANPDSRDRDGYTPLMCLMNLTFMVKAMESMLLLIRYGADINAKNGYKTVMHYAALVGNPKVVYLLIKQGARVNCNCPEVLMSSPLHIATLKGDVVITRMLLDAGAQVNASNSVAGSPLHVACTKKFINKGNQKKIVKILLESGADLNRYTDEDRTLRPALTVYLDFTMEPCGKIVGLLLRYGARVVMKSEDRDPHGILLQLHKVMSDKFQHIFYLLLEAAEAFDVCMINSDLTTTQKLALIQRAMTPISLLSQARIALRRHYGPLVVDLAYKCGLPKILSHYLQFK